MHGGSAVGKVTKLSKEQEDYISRWVGLVREHGVEKALEIQRGINKTKKRFERTMNK